MRLLTGLLAAALCCAALIPAAFASADAPEPAETADPVQETEALENMSIENDNAPVTGGTEALTPEGNLTLVDDIQGEAAGDKQFITVQTKAGNTLLTGRRTARTPSTSSTLWTRLT